jgi:hypothetical protein
VSGLGAPVSHNWRIADQYFLDGDVEIATKPYNDGYVMVVTVCGMTQRVFFDPAGRITHVR